ncbi:MAG: GNAT family N-acetyltransferase, partial [Pirellulales bacterium]|nr:GNAT family N-acetyltransferase [Pirellulales bacterium]
GQTRLCWLEIDGRLAAAELHLAGPRTVYAYQSGVNPHLLEHEPGRIITLATLRGALADGFAEFDFLRGDEPYKAHWRAEPRPQVVWRAVAPRMLPRARFAAWQAARKLRRSLKKLTENLRSRTAVSTSQAAARELPAPSAPVSPDGPVASDDTEALAALSDSNAGARADQHGHASGRAQPQEVAR